ncbi:hypothetical protein [uncultured Hyphomonas sp.]|uniref:hypothetical protein n=1 Tax=uncultured Hyphomonas sp. TaxID=225298 RepID=UPI002AAA75D1|nr:hypothetical protein [uncultured Hyphomonas sp.]
MKPYYPDAIDPHRPWIKDARDNPHDMNWGQVLFNPLGTSPKLHFTRAWTLMFLGRILLFIVPVFAVFVASLSGADLSGLWQPVEAFVLPVPELLLPFFIFTIVTELTSWVAHVRRLNDAHKSPLRAMIVLLPLMLGLVGFYLGAQGGIKQYEQMNAPKPAVSATDGAAASPADAKPQPQQQRRGPPGPPPSERDVAASSGLGFATMLWAPASFFVMLWSLLYVARIPNGGVGRFRTGSDIAQGEEELPSAYAAG